MSTPLILGIDPGLTGAAVLLRPPATLLEIFPFDSFSPNSRKTAEYLADLARQAALVVIEKPSAMPASKNGGKGQGVASAFNFGYSCGFIRGVTATHPNAKEVRPAIWKAKLGLSADKRECCDEAVRLFPMYREFFFGPRGGPRDGPAEAALLAHWGSLLVPSVEFYDWPLAARELIG